MTDAPERIWAWYFTESKRDDIIKGGWDDTPDRKTTEYVRADAIEALRAENERLREVLGWYLEQVSGCRLIHSGGDKHRQALSDDGGNRARAALTAEGE